MCQLILKNHNTLTASGEPFNSIKEFPTQVYQGSGELRRQLDPNISYGEVKFSVQRHIYWELMKQN